MMTKHIRQFDLNNLRDNKVDFIKGVAIVLMVIVHSGAPNALVRFIYLFHMAVFFMASGYLWNTKHAESVEKMLGFLKRKIKTLYVPFVLCNGVYVLANNLLCCLNIYSVNDDFLTLDGTDYTFEGDCFQLKKF